MEGVSLADGQLNALSGAEGAIHLVVPETGEEVARLQSPAVGRLYATGFLSAGGKLLALSEETGVLYIFDLHLIREQLAELGLDWGGATSSAASATLPTKAAPLQVELIDAEWGTSKDKMAQYESRQAVASLYFNPFDSHAHFRLGARLLEGGKTETAYAHLTTALAFRPDLDEALYLRAVAASRLRHWDDAAADLNRFLKGIPFDTPGRRLRAQVNRSRKRHEDAIDDYNSLLKTYPSSAVFYEARSRCYEALGKKELAKADREKALKLGADGPQLLNSQAWHLVTGPPEQRDPAEALKLMRQAIAQRPNDPLLLNTLGVAQYRNGQYKEAVATLEKSMAAGKGSADGFDLFFLAMCHAKQGDHDKAKGYFDRAVKWVEGKKDLSSEEADELRAFRAEAEELLPR